MTRDNIMLKDESLDSSIDEENEDQPELSLRETLEAAQAEVKSALEMSKASLHLNRKK